MIVTLQPTGQEKTTPPRLWLKPENEAEQAILRLILDRYQTTDHYSHWLEGIKEIGIALEPLNQ